ncbi:MAG: glycosyltransferase family 39 protein [Acidobacteria bacterium]|nr:glycosyltransferase family 39 protein [Acidobacteriota bacterium]
MTKLRHFDLNWLLAALLSVFAWAPLTYPGFFQSRSGLLAAYAVLDLELLLRTGAGFWRWRPPAWAAGSSPLAYWLAEILHGLGLGPLDAVRVLYGLGLGVSVLAAYGFGRRLLGRGAGLLSAVAYLYVPYHLDLVYREGAFTAALAWALLPFLFWTVDLAATSRRLAGTVLNLVALAVLFLADTRLALVGLALALVYALGRAISEHPPAAIAHRQPKLTLDLGVRTGDWLLPALLAAAVLLGYAHLLPRFVDSADLPPLQQPPLARLGERLVLLEAQTTGELRPGGVITLTLYWQDLGGVDQDYTVFVHLLDARDQLQGQHDGPPLGGTRPTSGWLPGEYLRDVHPIEVVANAPPGTYSIEVGMYLLATSERLPVAGRPGETSVIVTRLQLR